MGWTRHGLGLYICAILNMFFAFYNIAREEAFLTVIVTITYLINIYAVAAIEDGKPT